MVLKCLKEGLFGVLAHPLILINPRTIYCIKLRLVHLRIIWVEKYGALRYIQLRDIQLAAVVSILHLIKHLSDSGLLELLVQFDVLNPPGNETAVLLGHPVDLTLKLIIILLLVVRFLQNLTNRLLQNTDFTVGFFQLLGVEGVSLFQAL